MKYVTRSAVILTIAHTVRRALMWHTGDAFALLWYLKSQTQSQALKLNVQYCMIGSTKYPRTVRLQCVIETPQYPKLVSKYVE